MRDLNVTLMPVRRRTAISSRLACVALALMGCGLGHPLTALAQQHSQVPPGLPGPAGMGGRGMGGMSGQPGVPGRPIPGAPNPGGVKGPVQELKIDPNKLPENFAPPASKDPVMEIDRPLALQDEIDKLKKDLAKYQTTLRTARSSDPDKILIRNGLRYRLALMCLKDNRLQLSKLHDDLSRDLNSAAQAPDSPKPQVVKEFRQLVLQELVNQAAPLLTTQNFYVRLHIAILLGELNLTEESTKLALKVEAFVPACDPLIQVITDPKQPEAVKVAAVNGIVRILRLGNPNVTVRTKAAEALVGELKEKKSHPWYQMRLAGALSAVDIDLDQARIKPSVVEILKAVLVDEDRAWSVRAEAAKSLGRVPLPPSVNPPSVTRAVADFTLKLAKAAQQSPQQKADDPKWKSEFIKVYLAFQQLDAADLVADKKTKAGLLNNPAAAAKPAYDLIVPLVSAILHGQRLTVQQVQTLETYVGPQNQPIQSSKPPKAVPAEANQSQTVPMTAGAGGSK